MYGCRLNMDQDAGEAPGIGVPRNGGSTPHARATPTPPEED